MNMFTLGQKARMDFTFYGDETDPGYRAYLISQENLELTGTADPYTTSDCAPITGFHFDQGSDYATQKMICVGENVDFEEDSYNGDVDSYAWTFEGGNPSTDDSANPNNIEYNTPGRYDVSLEVSNAIGSSAETANDMIIVSPTSAQFQSSWGYVDSFWDEQAFLDNYIIFNQDDTEHKWERFQGPNGCSPPPPDGGGVMECAFYTTARSPLRADISCRSHCTGRSGARAGSGPCRSPCTCPSGARACSSLVLWRPCTSYCRTHSCT